MGTHSWNRRYLRRTGLFALVVVLGVGVWQGVAAATGGKTVKIQHHNANCGRSVGTEAIGSATFSRDGNTVFVDVNLVSGIPEFDYEVDLYMVKSNGGCKFIDDMGVLGTDENGQGQGEFSSQVDPKAQKFFVDLSEGLPFAPATNGGDTSPFDNDSLIVKLKG